MHDKFDLLLGGDSRLHLFGRQQLFVVLAECILQVLLSADALYIEHICVEGVRPHSHIARISLVALEHISFKVGLLCAILLSDHLFLVKEFVLHVAARHVPLEDNEDDDHDNLDRHITLEQVATLLGARQKLELIDRHVVVSVNAVDEQNHQNGRLTAIQLVPGLLNVTGGEQALEVLHVVEAVRLLFFLPQINHVLIFDLFVLEIKRREKLLFVSSLDRMLALLKNLHVLTQVLKASVAIQLSARFAFDKYDLV